MIHIRSGICGTSVFDIYANGTSAKQDAGAPNQVGHPYSFIDQDLPLSCCLEHAI